MCDYSLHAEPNRLAIEGEQLVVHRFSRGSIGLASPSDLNPPTITVTQQDWKLRPWWSWTVIRTRFQTPKAELRAIPAVCVAPGARLFLKDIPRDLQQVFKVSDAEEVTFVQISAEANTYRDAIRFRNGRQLMLQQLSEGQRVDVFRLSHDEAQVDLERLQRFARFDR